MNPLFRGYYTAVGGESKASPEDAGKITAVPNKKAAVLSVLHYRQKTGRILSLRSTVFADRGNVLCVRYAGIALIHTKM